MYIFDRCFQNLRNVPEDLRTPHFSNKEIEKMVQNILWVNASKCMGGIIR